MVKYLFRPIDELRTREREYCDLVINIYNGCNHGCSYCYAKKNYKEWNEFRDFSKVSLCNGLIENTKNQLNHDKLKGKKVMLCFTCDPYPKDIDTMPTRDIIKYLKEAGANVQILTKGGNRAIRDLDLLSENDSFGITLSFLSSELSRIEEPNAALPEERISTLKYAAKLGIKTWVNFEPVIDPSEVLMLIERIPEIVNRDTFLRIGKFNLENNKTDWTWFGNNAELVCEKKGWKYFIKEDLREQMK